MEVLKVALLISTLASSFCKGSFNIEYKKHDPTCVCMESAANSIPVDELLRHNEETTTERLVVILYKVEGNHYVYIPNPKKQRLIPELPFEENDFLYEITAKPIIELFNDNPFVINKHNNKIISHEEPLTPKNIFDYKNKLIDKLNRLINSPGIHGINDWPDHPFKKLFEISGTLFPYPAANPYNPYQDKYPINPYYRPERLTDEKYVSVNPMPSQWLLPETSPVISNENTDRPGYYDKPINFPVNPSKVHPYPLVWPLYQNAEDDGTNEHKLVDYPDINPYIPYPLIWTKEENIAQNDKDQVNYLDFHPYLPHPLNFPLDQFKALTYYHDKPEITYWFPSSIKMSPVAPMPEWIENSPPFFGTNGHDPMMGDIPCDSNRTSCKIIRIVSYLIQEKPIYQYAIDCNNHINEKYEVDFTNVSDAPKLEMYQQSFGGDNKPLIFNEWIEKQWKLIRNTSTKLTCHSFKVLIEKILLDNYIILADDGYLIDPNGIWLGTNDLIMNLFSIGQPINVDPTRPNFNASKNLSLFEGYMISSRFPPKILGLIPIEPGSLKGKLNIDTKLEDPNSHIMWGTGLNGSDNNGQSINSSIKPNITKIIQINSNLQSNASNEFKIKWRNFLDQIQAEIDESGGNEILPSLGYKVNLKDALSLLNLIDVKNLEMFNVIKNLDLNNLNIESLSTILSKIIEAVNTQRIKHDPLTKYFREHNLGTNEDEPFYRIIGGSAATGSGFPVNNKGF